MATGTLYQSFNFLSAQDWFWDVTAYSASSLTITSTDGVYSQNFAGTFTYNDYYQVFGTVTSTSFYKDGSQVYSATGLSASARQLQIHAETYGDTQETHAYALQYDDTINGSAGNDTVVGYAGNDLLKGNAGADGLHGYTGNDTLNGGTGIDNMVGGTGDDLYLVDNIGDKLTELAGEGYDTAQSSVTYALSANVEKLVLTGGNAINATGNGLKNLLIGNGANNKLYGNDNNDKLVGNDGNDSLYGGKGNDTLQGGNHSDLMSGGEGKDSLTGGAGGDYFVFNTALNALGNVDTVTDFTPGADKIWLDDDIFTALGPVASNTALAAGKFYKAAGAASAHDADDRIIYDTTSGALYYDADGVGGTAAVKFAALGATSHPNVSSGDFVVVV